jgi:hypothetical protein
MRQKSVMVAALYPTTAKFEHRFCTFVATDGRVIVRIVMRATGTVDGIPLDKYTPGEAYDLSPALAEYLIVQGFAISEMRAGEPRRSDKKDTDDRRKTKR